MIWELWFGAFRGVRYDSELWFGSYDLELWFRAMIWELELWFGAFRGVRYDLELWFGSYDLRAMIWSYDLGAYIFLLFFIVVMIVNWWTCSWQFSTKLRPYGKIHVECDILRYMIRNSFEHEKIMIFSCFLQSFFKFYRVESYGIEKNSLSGTLKTKLQDHAENSHFLMLKKWKSCKNHHRK